MTKLYIAAAIVAGIIGWTTARWPAQDDSACQAASARFTLVDYR